MLKGPNGPVEDDRGMLHLATDFYKNLLGYEECLNVKLDDNFLSEQDKLSIEENISSKLTLLKRKLRRLFFTPMLKRKL